MCALDGAAVEGGTDFGISKVGIIEFGNQAVQADFPIVFDSDEEITENNIDYQQQATKVFVLPLQSGE